MSIQKLRDITDDEGNYVRIERIDERINLMAGMNLTAENYHVLEYILNNMVGLQPQIRILFKEDTRRDIDLNIILGI